MIKFARKKANSEGSDFLIYVTKTQNRKTDPLTFVDKVDILAALGLRQHLGWTEKYTIFDVITTLQEEYTDLEFVVGGDQYKSFVEMFEKYGPDYKARLSVTKFEGRDKYPISATRMREYAKDGDWVRFTENCPDLMSPNQRLEMFRKVSVALQGHVRNKNDIAGTLFPGQILYD